MKVKINDLEFLRITKGHRGNQRILRLQIDIKILPSECEKLIHYLEKTRTLKAREKR